MKELGNNILDSLSISDKKERYKKMNKIIDKSASAYEMGFCKYAESQGIDPKFLARFMLSKEAQAASGTGFWDNVKNWIDQFKTWYGNQDSTTKALVGAGGGALLGGAIGSAFNKGGVGALLGGLGGAGAALGFDSAGNPKLNA